MKKAFTLIELLAVIILLAIITLIATPIILNVIEDSRESANLSQAYLLLNGAETYYAQTILGEEEITFDGTTNLYHQIETTNEKPPLGNIKINDKGEIFFTLYLDNRCYSKNFEDKDLTVQENVESEQDCVPVSIVAQTNSKPIDGWYGEDIEVTITTNGDSFEYCINGCSEYTKVEDKTTTITLTQETNELCFVAHKNGIIEDTRQCITYKIDKTEPGILAKTNNYSFIEGTSFNSKEMFEIVYGRTGGEVTCSPNNISTLPPGNHTIVCTAKNNAGMSESAMKDIEIKYNSDLIVNDNENTEIFNYTGSVQTFTAPQAGFYKMETWGAQGGSTGEYLGSDGAYTAGNIYLEAGQTVYIQVGSQGKTATTNSDPASAGYNGGGVGNTYPGQVNGAGAGGATDIRLVAGNWNDATSLNSRIMVSAGGVGVANWVNPISNPAPGGGLTGYNGKEVQYGSNAYTNAYGATQTSGGAAGSGARTGYTGTFGIGGNPQAGNPGHGSGGSGGYYGGGGGSYNNSVVGSGSSGSSYISGHTGAVAITSQTSRTPKTGCTTGTSNQECSIHYSGYQFQNTIMIDGYGYIWANYKLSQGSMPNPNGGVYEEGTGHKGDGVAKITYLGETDTTPITVGTQTNFIYNGSYHTYTVEQTGYYKLEAWGAEGGLSNLDGGSRSTGHAVGSVNCMPVGHCYGGQGSYTTGSVYLNAGDLLYVYVGGKGQNAITRTISKGGYNGGGNGESDRSDNEADGAGGGATDFRLVSGTWNNAESLNSRIMVAAGGAGASHYTKGSAGGGLTSVKYGYSNPATQTSGNSFGIGASGVWKYSNKSVSGAGGGYYGGIATNGPSNIYDNPASSGSSFISGHTGAIAITSATDRTPKENCENGTTDINCSIHYSGLQLVNTYMIDGNGFKWTDVKEDKVLMPSPLGGFYTTGYTHKGNGAAKITYLGN